MVQIIRKTFPFLCSADGPLGYGHGRIKGTALVRLRQGVCVKERDSLLYYSELGL